MLFHFQISDTFRGKRKKQVAIENQRIIESLILDFLCLDQEKSLVKVPLCALKALQTNPGALHPATHPKAAKLTIQRFSGCKVAY